MLTSVVKEILTINTAPLHFPDLPPLEAVPVEVLHFVLTRDVSALAVLLLGVHGLTLRVLLVCVCVCMYVTG